MDHKPPSMEELQGEIQRLKDELRAEGRRVPTGEILEDSTPFYLALSRYEARRAKEAKQAKQKQAKQAKKAKKAKKAKP